MRSYTVYARSPSSSQRPAPTTIACSCIFGDLPLASTQLLRQKSFDNGTSTLGVEKPPGLHEEPWFNRNISCQLFFHLPKVTRLAQCEKRSSLLVQVRLLLEFSYFLVNKIARRWTSWQLFEATDFNGSVDRQCGLCPRNCERQRCLRRNLFYLVYFLKPLSLQFF